MFYDKGVFQSKSYNFPIIAIGNISVGGTGKTPMTAYVIKQFIKERTVGVLSRGYKRQSEGFVLADEHTTAAIIGDEPFQLYSDFPEATVAVDANRQNGIATLEKLGVLPEVLLLDDAFQHRKVKAGFYMLLTTYNQLYVDDFMLPTGNLRDTKNQVKRADCIVVTKCPDDFSEEKKQQVLKKLATVKPVYFSKIGYSNTVYKVKEQLELEDLKERSFTLVTGIAKPAYLVAYLKNAGLHFEHLSYSDHHNFTDQEVQTLRSKELIITTQKDYVRLQDKLDNIFYLPIETLFIDGEQAFVFQLHDFVSKWDN
ncbi:tetraacyldisaccharide 4'-kinase [Neptunitalea chrysea]|uniref:Tetraacyldisaccharide 4'-kinase n=1 Tax=Neptunitalea chrysea TaxID=1647581 RepID=A0A9W6B3X6_9FLAO|nr:tetraacyldisaccharide 4'-kinase [Neptunitalea chrysea]